MRRRLVMAGVALVAFLVGVGVGGSEGDTSSLEADLASAQEDEADAREGMEQLQQRIETLESDLESIGEENSALKAADGKYRKDISRLEAKAEQLQAAQARLQKQLRRAKQSQASAAAPSGGGGGGGSPSCDPSYPDVCIAPYPPDLNCGDIPHRRFRVVGSDPHGFDGDNDGIGCES